MNTVHFVPNFFEPQNRRTEVVDDVTKCLQQQWDRLPANTSIYHGQIGADHDVTPYDVDSVHRFQKLSGTFYVVTVPGTPLDILLYAAIFTVAYTLVTLANIPTLNSRNLAQESPNNELSSRENSIRLGGRIPDMFGENISTPDLIGVPYFVYENHKKVEFAEMCFGRGAYDFALVQSSVYEVRDGDTLISEIDGAVVNIYGPFQSGNTVGPFAPGTEPIMINGPVDEPIRTVKRISAVNGQTLEPPNADELTYDYEIGPAMGFKLLADPGSAIDFTTDITVGDYVSFTCKKLPVGAYQSAYFYAGTAHYLEDGIFQVDVDPVMAGESGEYSIFDTVSEGSILDIVFTIEIASVDTYISGRFSVVSVTPDGTGGALIELFKPWLIAPALTGYTGTSELFVTSVQQRYGTLDFSGRFLVDSVSTSELVFNEAQVLAENGNWYYHHSLADDWTELADTGGLWYGLLSNFVFDPLGGEGTWIGPFTINLPDMGGVIANFVAVQGLYKDTGSSQTAIDIDVELELTPVNVSGEAIGPSELLTATVLGSDESRAERAQSIISDGLDEASYYSVRARRVTPRQTIGGGGVVVDEIKWADLYGTKLFLGSDFGNVTTVRAVTTATTGALAVKSRKLTARMTRKVKQIQTDNTLTTALVASKRFSDIAAHICMDPYIGNRPESEVDLAHFKATYDAVVAYFGSTLAGEFSYTFDKIGMSFEDTMSVVSTACHSIAYREGVLIKQFFERSQDDSIILFNHRNKLPRSEIRTYDFGIDGDYDGIDFEYTQRDDGTRILYQIPTDLSAVKPKKIVSAGVQSTLQAYFLAWREWHKMLYRRVASEFTATQEAEILIPNQKVLIADNTRANVQDGEIRAKASLIVETSQPVQFDIGEDYTIFLQHTDGTVQSMPAYVGADEYHVVLDAEPSVALSIDPDNYALTTYLIVRDDDVAIREFLMVEREVAEGLKSKVTAINYDARYYSKDLDYVNDVIDVNGNPL